MAGTAFLLGVSALVACNVAARFVMKTLRFNARRVRPTSVPEFSSARIVLTREKGRAGATLPGLFYWSAPLHAGFGFVTGGFGGFGGPPGPPRRGRPARRAPPPPRPRPRAAGR